MKEGKTLSNLKDPNTNVPPPPAPPPARPQGESKGVYFYSGPEGYFYVNSIDDGERILSLMRVDSDEWTATLINKADV